MQSRSHAHPFIQVIFIVFLMSIIAWLATGWQESPPTQLGFDQENQLHPEWSEQHLVTPVTNTHFYVTPEHLHAM